MSASRRAVLACSTLVVLVLMLLAPQPAVAQNHANAPAAATTPPAGNVPAEIARMPLSFEPNQGQAAQGVMFVAHPGGNTLLLNADAATFVLASADAVQASDERRPQLPRMHTAILRMEFASAKAAPEIRGLELQPHRSNYFAGRDPKGWHTNVPHYARVQYREVYPGIDLLFHGNQKRLEYDFVIAPGADPTAIALRLSGAERVEVDASGDLVIHAGTASLRQHKPVAYQERDGAKVPVAVQYAVAKDKVTFKVADYDRSRTLVIDPVLVYSTYFGGSGFEVGARSLTWWGAIAADANGNAYISGVTTSTDLPVKLDQNPTSCPTCSEAQPNSFVAAFRPDGTLIYSTYLGGTTGFTTAAGFGGIAADNAGNAYVTGSTNASDFPTTPDAFQTQCGADGLCNGGGNVGFISKLSPTGALVYSTFLGSQGPGACGEDGIDLKVDNSGIYVVGDTCSADFPTTPGAFQTTFPPLATNSLFVAKLNPAASPQLVYSTLLQGNSQTNFYGASRIAVDGAGSAYVAGPTYDFLFPTVPSQPAPSGGLSKSVDGGASWAKINWGFYEKFVRFVRVDPANSNNIFVAASATLLRSTDGGASFEDIGGALGGVIYVQALEIAPATANSPETIYVAVRQNGLWASTDAGNTWVRTAYPRVNVTRMVIDRAEPQKLYVSYPAGGLMRSTDGGATWSDSQNDPSNTGLPIAGITALAIDPANHSILYAGTNNANGVYKSVDSGATWAPINNGLSLGVADLFSSPEAVSNITCVVPDFNHPGIVYLCVGGATAFRSTDSGASWSRMTVLPGGPNWGGGIRNFLIRPNGNVYAATYNFGLFKSTDNGTTWTAMNSGQDMVNTDLVADPNNPNVLYSGTLFSGSFLAKLSPDGSRLIYSHFVGSGNGVAQVFGLSLRPGSAAPTIAGWTTSTTLTTTAGAIQPAKNGPQQGFVAWYGEDGGLQSSTYLGGSGYDMIFSVGVDYAGTAYVVGATTSTDFPVVTPLYSTHANDCALPGSSLCTDGFVAKLDPNPMAIQFSTYLPGSKDDVAYDVAVSGATAYVVGATNSPDFPTLNAYQSAPGGNKDAFVLALDFSNTPAGIGSSVNPIDGASGASPVALTFGTVTQGGDTSLTITNSGPLPPAGYSLGNPARYYNVRSTAAFNTVHMCIDYSSVAYSFAIPGLHMFQYVGSGWAEVATQSAPSGSICADVSALGTFIVAEKISNAALEEWYAIVERTTSQVRFYNATNDAPRLSIATGTNPNAVAFAPGGRLAYVANINSGYLSVIDLTIGAEVGRVKNVRPGYLLALSKDGKTLVSGNGGADGIFVIDTATLTSTQVSFDGKVGDTPGMYDVSTATLGIANNKVYVNSSYGVIVVDLASRAVKALPTFGGTQRTSLAVTPDERYVYTLLGSMLCVIDTATDTIVQQAYFPPRPRAFALNPANPGIGYLVYVNADNTAHLKIMNVSLTANFGAVAADLPLGIDMVSGGILSLAVNQAGTRALVGRRGYDYFPDAAKVDLVTNTVMPLNVPHIVQNVQFGMVAGGRPATAPTVTDISPAAVTNEAPHVLTITGANFAADAKVRIGNLDPIPATVTSSTSLQVTLPAAPAAQGAPIVVTNPNLGQTVDDWYQSGVLRNAFTIASPATFKPAHQIAVVNWGDASLSILNASTNTVVAPAIPLDNSPMGIALSPDGYYAFVNSVFPAGVMGADLFHNTPMPYTRVDQSLTSMTGQYIGVAVGTTNNKLRAYLIANNVTPVCDDYGCIYDDVLYTLDADPTSPTYRQVLGSIDTHKQDYSSASLSLALTPDGRYVYHEAYAVDVYGNATGYFNIFDVSSGTLAASNIPASSLEIGDFTTQLGMTSDGKYLFASTNSGAIQVLDISSPLSPTKYATIAPVPVAGMNPVMFSSYAAVGGRLFALDGVQGVLEIFNFDNVNKSYGVLGSYVVPGAYTSTASPIIAVTPDGNLVYVPLPDNDAVAVVDVNRILQNSGNPLLTTIATGFGPTVAAVRPGTPTPPSDPANPQPVTVAPIEPVSVTFQNVVTPGVTTVATANSSPLLVPAGFQLGNPPVFYEISSTAAFAGPVDVCFHYNPAQFIGAESQLHVLHEENGEFVDVTTSQDLVTHTICGRVTHFSLFTVGSGTVTPPAISATATPQPNTAGWNNSNVSVTLTASGTSVSQIQYTLSGAQNASATVNGSSATVNITAEGQTTLIAKASGAGGTSQPVTVTVKIDKTAPSLACSATPSSLWPPNDKLVNVSTNVTVSDSGSGATGFTLQAVTSSESEEGNIVGWTLGAASTSGQLRATRTGGGNGRTYTLTYRGTDKAGNAATCTTTVTVPHDNRK